MAPMWPLSMIPLVSHKSCGAPNYNPLPLPSLYWEPPKHVQTCSTRTSPYRTPWDMVKLVQLRPHTLGTQAHYPPPHLPDIFKFVSLHIRSMWETTVMHKQVSGWTVNFGPNSPVYPFLELKTRIPPPPFRKTSDLGWPKFTPKYPPPHFGKLQIWDHQSLLRNTPPYFGKLQIWDHQSLLWNTPPPFWKTSDLGSPKFTPKYPPILENFRFGITKVYSEIPPPFWKTSDLGSPKFTPKYPPPFWKTSDLGSPKFTPKYPPPFWKTSDLGSPKFTPKYPPHFGKLQIWDHQSLLRNTPPILEKLQIWDHQSLLRNTPPILENFRFGITKVYSEIPPHIRKLSESPRPRFLEYRELLHVETLSNPDNY